MKQKHLYMSIVDYITEKISSREYSPGDLIPSESKLSKQMKVSVGTVRKAIDILERGNSVYRVHGKGTYISQVNFDNNLFKFTSYGDATGADIRIRKETIKRALIPGTKELCIKLNISPNSDLIYLERIGYIDTVAAMFEKSWWPAQLVAGLQDKSLHIPDLLYGLISSKFNVHVVRSDEILTASSADSSAANALGIKSDSCMIKLIRTAYTHNNKIVEYRETYGCPDKFSYKSEINIHPKF